MSITDGPISSYEVRLLLIALLFQVKKETRRKIMIHCSEQS